MTKPCITLNGTSAADLRAGYVDAMSAVANALDAVRKVGPNGRDYCQQTDGFTAMEKARAEHFSRLQLLTGVHQELEELALHCDEHCRD